MPVRLSAPNAPAATDNTSPRADGRRPDQLRPIRFQNHIAPYASGSTLIEWGNTRVICGVTVEETVPRWMKEQNVAGGWITAEYSMLPYSTPQRKQRDISKGKIDGRSQEIQRLIGRSVRAVVDRAALGERTVRIDCDVLQADGGTRCASITGACVAVADAILWCQANKFALPTDKRGLFKSWTLLLAILAFSMSMLGTFLVRSGVLVSVHSFAADPSRGIFILAFLIVMIGGALSLYAWRAPLLKSTAGFELGARESFLLFNNVLLVIAAATVFAGTLAPLISDALKLGTVSVGPPYFNPTFMLSMLPLLALLSVGIHSNWKRGRLKDKQRTLLYTLVAAAVLACGVVFGIYSHGRMLTPVGATLALWIVLASLVDPIDRWRRGLSLSRAVVGMTVAHLGLALAALALTTVQSFTIEKDVALAPGASTSAGGYEFRFDGVRPLEGPNYDAVGATISVTRNGAPVTVLKPEKRHYWVQGNDKTVTNIEMHRGANILVALGDDLGAGRWSVRIQIRPLVSFIWLAALVMAIGGALAASDRRYRTARAPEAVSAGVATGDATP